MDRRPAFDEQGCDLAPRQVVEQRLEVDASVVAGPQLDPLAEAAPDARVHIVSNVHEVVGSRKPWGERKDLFFVGGYQHPPNIDAAQWFVGSIWPLIRDRLPDATFHLIGSKAPDAVRALDGNGVRFHGFVESLEPWLDSCRLAVAPLRYGAGIKGKVHISMSRGQPVVDARDIVTGSAGYGIDGTTMPILLPEPLASGDSLTIDIDWAFKVPQRGASGRGRGQSAVPHCPPCPYNAVA